MVVFTFHIGTAPMVDSNLCDVRQVDGDCIEITCRFDDAVRSGLFRRAARIPYATVAPHGQDWRAVPAYRWYGQLVARRDPLDRLLKNKYEWLAKYGYSVPVVK